MACLPSDPGPDPARQAAAKDKSAGVVQPNTSPSSLADHILKNRSFSESPLFTAQVAEGVLPPVADRLPQNPLVVRPLKMIGIYGGTLRRALTGDIVQTAGVSKALGEDLMSFVRPMPTGIVYSLAESHTYEDEGRVARVHRA